MKSLVVIFALAILLRVSLIYSDYRESIADRVEVSTPLNSFLRILESRYRVNIGIDPYSGDVLHESPLHLRFYSFLIDHTGSYLPLTFVLTDVLTGIVLYLFTKKFTLNLLIDQYINRNNRLTIKKHMLKASDYDTTPRNVAALYLFNPYVVLNCVACTTTVFLNLKFAVFLYAVSCGSILFGTISLSLAAFHSFYPVIFISPLFLSIYQKSTVKAVMSIVLTLMLLTSFTFVSFYIQNNWTFLQQTYGFILRVPDQRPNVGVYWYFFMEMFEHFKELFMYSYQINVTLLYFVPLTLTFRKHPVILTICFMMLISIFKSYPCIGDFGFVLSLLPSLKHMYKCMQQIFVSTVTIVTTTVLAPILWNLWIYWGSANANFFFGATLAFITAQIFILTDVGFAHSKREYLLRYGTERKVNGKVAKLVLN